MTLAMFTNNTADELGGGIFVGRYAKATIKSSTFDGSVAGLQGVVLCTYCKHITMSFVMISNKILAMILR